MDHNSTVFFLQDQRNILHKKDQCKYLVLLSVSVEPLHSSQADRLEEMLKYRIHIKSL